MLDGTAERRGRRAGAYVLSDDAAAGPDVVLIGTGSEVSVCVEAAATLEAEGVAVRVVSMPSWELFEAQPTSYRDAVLPPAVPTLAVEAGATLRLGALRRRRPSASTASARRRPGEVVLRRARHHAEHVVERGLALLVANREQI